MHRTPFIRRAALVICVGIAVDASAQTTAGSATTIVFPVTAQTVSFASEVTLFNPGPNPLTASVGFYEANDSSTPGVKSCSDISVAANRSASLTLATQCALAAGSHFGLLVVADKAQTNSFYGFMRVQNPQGIGFSVEGFPAANFNNQVSNATGLKRQAAAPGYQTNCFVGSLDTAVGYQLKLYNGTTGVQIGTTLTGTLQPFQQYRYLDVFGAEGVNAPAGDQLNVRAEFTQSSGGSAKLIGFCTVQDNTSFGADFRIAKSYGTPGTVASLTQGSGIVLTPNPITTTGTIAADTTYLQRRVSSSCAVGSSIRAIAADGTVTCQTDANSGGTVTSVSAGTGLSGGPITTSGTLAADTTYLQRRVSSSCAAGSSIRAIAADGTVTCQTIGSAANAFVQGGNAFGATAHLGTTDNQPFELYVNNQRALRVEPTAVTPHVLGGYVNNGVYAGLVGVTIGGGGAPGAQGAEAFPPDARTCALTYGCINGVLDSYGTIAGGIGNEAGAGTAGVPGQAASVGGGLANWAYAAYSTIGGGSANTASGLSSAIAGGRGNTAGGVASVAAGGDSNRATGDYSVVGGGSDNFAEGIASTVPGGTGNVAGGTYSFSAGRNARATTVGEFVWGDSQPFLFNPSDAPKGWANATNTFNVRATGGVWFVTGIDALGTPTWGCTITYGSNLFCSSDRNLKRNLVELDGEDVLAKLAAMPVYRWQPKDGVNANDMHIGPMAQDFYAAFGLGHTDIAIGVQDEEGVALAAIKGLSRVLQQKDAQLDAQQKRLDALEATLMELQHTLAAMRSH